MEPWARLDPTRCGQREGKPRKKTGVDAAAADPPSAAAAGVAAGEGPILQAAAGGSSVASWDSGAEKGGATGEGVVVIEGRRVVVGPTVVRNLTEVWVDSHDACGNERGLEEEPATPREASTLARHPSTLVRGGTGDC